MSTYRELLLSPRWQKTRLRILDRDAWTCQICGRTDRTLHVHHAAYDPADPEPWSAPDRLLVTLCEVCHEAEPQRLKEGRYMLAADLAQFGVRTSLELKALTGFVIDELERQQAPRDPKAAFVVALTRFEARKAEAIRDGSWFAAGASTGV